MEPKGGVIPYRADQVSSGARCQYSLPPPLSRIWPALLPLPTVVLAAWVMIAWQFNGLYGQDPFAYFDFGVGPLRHWILDGAPLTAMFWPLGYPILITLSSLVLGPVTAAAQMVNVLAVVAAVEFTYLLGRDLLLQAGAEPSLARRTGLLGALLLSVTGRLIESSVLVMADAVALATALISAWALLHWLRDEPGKRFHDGWLALSATALAWSMVTRWGQAILVLVWLALFLTTVHGIRWRTLCWVIFPAAGVLGAQAWLIVTVRPQADLGPYPFIGDLSLVNGAGSGWSLAHMVQHHFVTPDGTLRYQWPNGLFYAAGPFLPQYLTPLFVPATGAGIITVVRQYRRALVLLVAWPLLVTLFNAGLAEQNPRFILPALPPIAVLTGLGLAVGWDRLHPHLRLPAAVALAAGLLMVGAIAMHEANVLNGDRNADLQVTRWASSRLPVRATILSFGITLTLQHETHLHVLDLSELTRYDRQSLVADQRPLYLLVQIGAMRGQFADRPPGINYRYLRSHPGLRPLGALHGYLLARVGPL